MAEKRPELSEETVERATKLLDIRRIIGALLGVYGLLLVGAGLFASEADKDKAAGVNINLWVGPALLAAAGLFFLWAATRSLVDELEEPDELKPGEPQGPG